jgi:hypothetical protein
MRANPFQGQVGGIWALEISTFLGPGVQESLNFQGPAPSPPPPTCPRNGFTLIKSITCGTILIIGPQIAIMNTKACIVSVAITSTTDGFRDNDAQFYILFPVCRMYSF